MWSQVQQEAFVEHLLRGGRNNVIRVNAVNWRSNTKEWGPVQLVDGKQRLTATLLFTENRLRAFGTLLREFEGLPSASAFLTFIINDLPDRASVLRWYLEINEGNVAHTPAELQKVRDMLRDTHEDGHSAWFKANLSGRAAHAAHGNSTSGRGLGAHAVRIRVRGTAWIPPFLRPVLQRSKLCGKGLERAGCPAPTGHDA